MIILLESDFNLGDIVSKSVDSENRALMVTGFVIHSLDSSGQVNHYSILCSDGDGNIVDYKAYELKRQEIAY